VSFDHNQASFWLVAAVVGWLLVIASGFLGACVLWRFDPTCASGKYSELLNTILASVLAFAAGRTSK
jgi:hypothetical protein